VALAVLQPSRFFATFQAPWGWLVRSLIPDNIARQVPGPDQCRPTSSGLGLAIVLITALALIPRLTAR
jgi:hypothetical protein